MVWDHGTRVRITVLPQVNEALSNEAPDFTGSKFYYEPLIFIWNTDFYFVYLSKKIKGNMQQSLIGSIN